MNTKNRNKTHTVITNASYLQATNLAPMTRSLEDQLLNEVDAMKSLKDPIGRRGFNAVSHIKGKLKSIASNTSSHEPDTHNVWTSVDCGSQFWHISRNPAIQIAEHYAGEGAVDQSPDTVAYYLRKCIKTPPRFISILNFLAEMRDLRGMIRVWSRKKQFLVNIASSRLAWEYGWKLFLQDVVSIMHAINHCRKQIKRFLDMAGKPLQRRYRVRLPGMGYTGSVRDVSLNSEHHWIENFDVNYPKFQGYYDATWKQIGEHAYECANVRYSWYIPALSEAQASLRSMLHAFGVEWNPRIIWDAIPWTFVIDWFLSIGDWIDQWNKGKDALPLFVRIHDMSISRKSHVHATAVFRWIKELAPAPGKFEYHTVECEGSVYTRLTEVQVIPEGKHLKTSGFTEFEISRLLNGLSLATVNTSGPDQRAPRNVKGPKEGLSFREFMNKLLGNPLTGKNLQKIIDQRRVDKTNRMYGRVLRKLDRNQRLSGFPGIKPAITPKLPREQVQINRGFLQPGKNPMGGRERVHN